MVMSYLIERVAKGVLFIALMGVLGMSVVVQADSPCDVRLCAIVIEDCESCDCQCNQRQGVVFNTSYCPQNPSCVANQLARQFIGCPVTHDLVNQIVATLRAAYRDSCCPFVYVSVPDQDLTCGVLKVQVCSAPLSCVSLRGNCCTPDWYIRKTVRVCEGSPVRMRRLQSDLAWLNHSPWRTTCAVFSPGDCCGTTNLQLVTCERKPWRIYYGWDNRGNAPIGHERQFAGFHMGNFPFIDDLISFQATTAANPKHMYAFSANYQHPFFWRHILDLYGGYAHLHTKKIQARFRNRGFNVNIIGRYYVPFCLSSRHWRSWFVGADYKLTNNTFLFDNTPQSGPKASLLQWVVGYSWKYLSSCFNSCFRAAVYFSPARWLSDQNETSYFALRPFSKVRYVYGRFSWEGCLRLPCQFAIAGWIEGQVASANLLPSEEFILGGADSVRGYPEKQLLADKAGLFKAELRRTMRAHLFRGDCLTLLAFVDYGIGSVNHKVPGQEEVQHLVGVGPGLRYHVGTCVSATVDYGFGLVKLQSQGKRTDRLHFTITASY